MEIREGFMPFLGYQTYYCIIGDLKSGKTPLLALHGGPGGKSERLRNLEPQVESGRALVLYDQIGGGKSAIEGSHKELWNSAIWIQELIALRQHLDLTEIHLMGQSWGGMLALQYVIE
ncbi:MAG: alpha/beta fold hydrolase, partial [Symbiobacteriaceae bacterium]|nr:alpha/beta fold hydrolase [Symbiobacteriaceae bacterium]